MHKRHNPDTVIEAFGKGYSQAIEIDPNKRWLFTAGQVGAAPDGSTPDSMEDQVAQTWANILALLNEGGMGIDDIVNHAVGKILDALTIPEGERDYVAISASDPAMGTITIDSPKPVFPRLELPEVEGAQ